MAKKPSPASEPSPDVSALDVQASPPAPEEPSESLVAVVARLHARIFSLEARVDAFAAHHLQTYGKAL